jgi:hypothetical protein
MRDTATLAARGTKTPGNHKRAGSVRPEPLTKGRTMANSETESTDYEKAREITEKALDALKDNDDAKAGKLIEEARRVDENAVQDVQEMLEEDADSEHDPARLNEDIAKQNRG